MFIPRNLNTFGVEWGGYFKYKFWFLILKPQLAYSLKKIVFLISTIQLNVFIHLNHSPNAIGHFENIP